MIARLLIAVTGAVIITAGLLLGMDTVTSLFRNQTGERYFRITDILPKAPPGRPERPPVLRQPARVEQEIARPGTGLPIEAPAAVDRDTPPLDAPALEPPQLE
jgi:hypothetical protein